MATVITRTQDVDDDGSYTTGTIRNNAWKQQIYDQIDALFTGALSLVGPLTVTGFGSHSISAGGTGGNTLGVRNTTAGTGNYAALFLGNDADGTAARLWAFSSSYTTSGPYVQDSTALEGIRAGGLSIAATHASGALRFYSGGTTEWVRLSAAGGLGLKDGITAPATVAGFALLYVDTADGDLKVKFGDGTVKTIVVDT